ncbi:Thymidylate kinase [hydrothermal vent metagenome]|uniref:Thymidylate kinase n=1 Tax=hydrothermal vent metagenome TaxID=652676 RepID=A0A1W1BEC8_9ZZZZ
MSNRLIDEESPYLRQHAQNPVDWYPWCDEAFSRARDENKAIFLSIGYSSCHWCHVMERESFENDEIANILNQYFISIKVDREERPDIDRHYQGVYQLMNGRPGGWPTSIFLTHDLKPFYSATYIPPEPRYGMMAFGQLLETIHKKYRDDRDTLIEKGREILSHLDPKVEKIEATKLDLSIVKRYEEQAKQLFDAADGGFNKAPKFPQASTLSLLLDTYRLSGDKESLEMVTTTLDSMSRGGLYDRVDGGFCRYSTDDRWLVPHFEKMTYDNALLSQLYLKAYYVTDDELYRDIAFETIDFMLSKMSEDRLFYSASDADTDGSEGDYFVYSYSEVLDAFRAFGIPPQEIEELMNRLNITKDGNFEGRNIIRIDDPREIDDIAHYQEALDILRGLRRDRVYPSIDEKIQLSWNAMMIKSLFVASSADDRYLQIAIDSLDKLTDRLYIDEELYHTTIIGKAPKIKAFLEDYAYLCDTLIEAYEVTLNELYLIMAVKLANSAIEKYFAQGIWKFSRGEFETKADIYDSSYPSAMATMLSSLLSISSLVDPVYKKFVYRTLEINSYGVMRQPISSPLMSQIVIRYLKDDIIIKADESKLLPHTSDRYRLPYPFSYIKIDKNDGFMLCTSSSCFGHVADWSEIDLNRRLD